MVSSGGSRGVSTVSAETPLELRSFFLLSIRVAEYELLAPRRVSSTQYHALYIGRVQDRLHWLSLYRHSAISVGITIIQRSILPC